MTTVDRHCDTQHWAALGAAVCRSQQDSTLCGTVSLCK